jgi:hypothetical protein
MWKVNEFESGEFIIILTIMFYISAQWYKTWSFEQFCTTCFEARYCSLFEGFAGVLFVTGISDTLGLNLILLKIISLPYLFLAWMK